MKKRSFWVEQVGKAWERRSVIWLSGVRRVGKTFLVTFVNLTGLIDTLALAK